MKVKEVYVEVGFTKSLPNYQNVKPTAGVRVEVEPGESVDEVFKNCWELVGKEVFDQVRLFEEEPKKVVKKGL